MCGDGLRLFPEGYRLTMLCDVDQENSVEHIWQCLDEIGVERVDHGLNAVEDRALVTEINRRGLGLTLCPISNSYVTDIVQLARNAFTVSWLPREARDQYLDELDTYATRAD